MDHDKSLLERAFELASSGECKTVAEVRYRLRAEGYEETLPNGPSLTKQLRDLIRLKAGPVP